MEDQLMRVFGGERIKNLMGTFKIPEDQPIENRMISRQLEGAQSRIEGFHFDARKQVLAYDNVLNQQREVVYARRRRLLLGDESEVTAIMADVIDRVPEAEDAIAAKAAEFGEEEWSKLSQRLALQMIDMLWVEHLEVMQYTRSSVNLRAYGQRDPLIEYRKEGLRLFNEMQETVLHRLAEAIPHVQVKTLEADEAVMQKARAAAKRAGADKQMAAGKQKPHVKENTFGRNDVVTITNGTETKELKYKKAEVLLQQGWSIVTT